MLDLIKERCYITTSIYDKEINSLINACIRDCIRCGIEKDNFEVNSDNEYDDLALNCVTNYVKAYRGNDRSQTEEYLKMYTNIRDEMSLNGKYIGGDSIE